MCLRGLAADYALSAAKVVLSGSAARTMRGGRGVWQQHHAVGGMEEGKKGGKKSSDLKTTRRSDSTKERKT